MTYAYSEQSFPYAHFSRQFIQCIPSRPSNKHQLLCTTTVIEFTIVCMHRCSIISVTAFSRSTIRRLVDDSIPTCMNATQRCSSANIGHAGAFTNYYSNSTKQTRRHLAQWARQDWLGFYTHQGARGRSSDSSALSMAAATVMQCSSRGSSLHLTLRTVKTL